MYCPFCGKETPNGAKFCTQCGEKLPSIKIKPEGTPAKSERRALFKNKKAVISIVSVLVVIALIAVCVNAYISANSIVGVWMNGTNKITFTSDGNFKMSGSFSMDGTYGTYTIDDNKTLILSSGFYSSWSGTWKYQYGSKAKENEKYWYISDGKLYFRGAEYTKK